LQKNIGEKFNSVIRAHERHRQTDRQTVDIRICDDIRRVRLTTAISPMRQAHTSVTTVVVVSDSSASQPVLAMPGIGERI